MKSFKQFLNEETMPYATTAKGIMDITDSSVRDGLNSQIAGVTAGKFVTPYIALERVSKALANFHIFIPRHSFLEGDSGMFVWPINQYGIKIGQRNDGTFVRDGEVLKDTSKGPHIEGEDNKTVSEPNTDVEKPFSVFFEYRQSDCGMFEVFCEVVDQDELDEILEDLEDEMNDEDKEDDEEELNEEKYTNRVPSANPYGNLDAAQKEMSKPKPVPTRKTDDLDKMNKDAEGNTVVEANAENKEKKKKFLTKGGQKLRDIRSKMKGNVKSDFDPCELKNVAEEENLQEVSKKTAIKAYIRRKSSSEDFYAEPGEKEKAEKTLSRIKKKFGNKTAAQAERGANIDSDGRSNRPYGKPDYLDAKQDVYSRYSGAHTKKGLKQRKYYMSLNKGEFKKDD